LTPGAARTTRARSGGSAATHARRACRSAGSRVPGGAAPSLTPAGTSAGTATPATGHSATAAAAVTASGAAGSSPLASAPATFVATLSAVTVSAWATRDPSGPRAGAAAGPARAA